MIRARVKRVRTERCQRNGYRDVEYSVHYLTDWIPIPGEGPLRRLEDAIEEINKRRLRHPEKNDQYVVEAEWPSRANTYDELKDFINDIDKGFRGHRNVM